MTRATFNADHASILGSEEWADQQKTERGSNSHNRLVRMPVRFLTPILMLGVPAGCAGFALLLGMEWRMVAGWGLFAFGPAALSIVAVYVYLDASYKRGDWDQKTITLERGKRHTPAPVIAARHIPVNENGRTRYVEASDDRELVTPNGVVTVTQQQYSAMRQRCEEDGRVTRDVTGLSGSAYQEFTAALVNEKLLEEHGNGYRWTVEGHEWLGLPYPH